MIVTIPVILALSVCMKDVSSASFSTVYRQNGHEYPIEYVKYDAPSFTYSPQIERLTAAPAGPVVSYSPYYPVSPCGTSCVYPEPAAPIAPNANIVQYAAPSLPVVITPSRNDPSGAYEYSYVVYNDQTGDHKAQREISDGSMVRGGYSFLQPDGYIREVQYVADDLQGFNAVVKHYVPDAVETKKHEQHGKTEPLPCHEVKNEHVEYDNRKKIEHSHENIHAEPTPDNHEKHAEASHKNAKLVHQELQHEHDHKADTAHEEHGHEAHDKKPVKPAGMHTEYESSHVAHIEHHEGQSEIEPVEDQTPHEAHSEHEESSSETAHVENAEIEISKAESHDVVQYTAPQEQHIAVVEPNIDNTNILIPYSDILRCIQAVLSGKHDISIQKQESPLSYIILNKPC